MNIAVVVHGTVSSSNIRRIAAKFCAGLLGAIIGRHFIAFQILHYDM